MRAAVSVGLFFIFWLFGVANAAELQRYHYPISGFSAEFYGDAKEIELKSEDQTRDYIVKTLVYEQHGQGYSFSVTAREYRYGTPDLPRLALIIKARLQCAGKAKQYAPGPDVLAISAEECLSGKTSFFARLLSRGRWYYQAPAVVPDSREADGHRFVDALQLTTTPEEHAAATAIKRGKTIRKLAHKTKSKLRLKRRRRLVQAELR